MSEQFPDKPFADKALRDFASIPASPGGAACVGSFKGAVR